MDLQERFAKGDLDAFETLFRQHQGRVFAWIMRIVRDAGHAEDLTVETFWRIYKSRDRFDLRSVHCYHGVLPDMEICGRHLEQSAGTAFMKARGGLTLTSKAGLFLVNSTVGYNAGR